MKLVAFVTVILVGSIAAAQSASSIRTWDAHSIVWQSTLADGSKYAVLEGDKNAAGKQFTYAAFVPAGSWDNHTHSHSQDARVTVVSGALLLAVGPDPDKKLAKSYPVGSYVLVPASLEHTMGADIDTIIIGTAVGPWKTQDNAEPRHH